MVPQIYTSHVPDVPVLSTSIFTRLFGSRHGADDVGGFPGSMKAFVDAATGATLTRAEVKKLALSFAYGLRDHPMTRQFAKRGDTLLIYSPNSLAWPVVLYGSVAAGIRCTLSNSGGARLVATAEEGINTVRSMFVELGFSKAEADQRIVVLGNDLHWAGGPAATLPPEASGLLTLADLLSHGTLKEEEKFDGAAAQETVYLCYSSGTTGKPKASTTHQNMTTLVDICRCVFPRLRPGDQPMLAILPFYHIYGVSNVLNFSLTVACPAVIQARFEPVQFCANIQKYKVVFAFIVPPVLVVLARHPAVDTYDLSSLEYMLSAAAPLGADLVEMVQRRLSSKHKAGTMCFIAQGYGLTETSPSTHSMDFPSAHRKPVSKVGHLLPNFKARLVEDDDGKIDAKEGQRGELWIQGPIVMKAFLRSTTKNAITPDGWFKTGDIATRDKDGYYYIVDRRKELIKYKRLHYSTVPPAELEAVLLTHPEIADVGVIGVNSVEQATELPRAYVAHAHPDTVKTAAAKAAFGKSVAKWIETKVARHKFLRGGVAVIDVVPKSAAGKILRAQLRDLAKAELARGEINTGFETKL
ncbi:AMP binding protein [Mycena crocata]|nr:AMP binding protein [Mycena crocata]